MNKKKLITVLLSIMMIFSLAACDDILSRLLEKDARRLILLLQILG